jgi:hypothetical protein
MSTPSQSSENPGPSDPAEHPPQAEISGVVLAPAPRGEPSSPEIHYEHFPRTSFSPTQLSERRKKMRPVVTWILGVSLVLIAAASIRSAVLSHEAKAPAAVVEAAPPPAQATAPAAAEPEAQPSSEEANAANASAEAKASAALAAQRHKTSQSHRPKKPGAH